MAIYRADRSFDGSYRIRSSSVDEEVGRAVGTAAGWAVGAGVDLAGVAARGIRDRRMLKAAKAMMEASASGDDDRFLALATEFTRRYPREELGHETRARALYAKERYDESLAELDAAVELGFDEWEGRSARAQVLLDAENYGAAMQEFTRLLENSKYRAQGFMGRAMCLATLADLDEALKNADEAVTALPGEESYQVRAVIHKLRGDDEKALADINRVLQLNPGDADYLEFRAEIYEEMGRTDVAQQDRDQARTVSAPAAEKTGDAAPTQTVAENHDESHVVATPTEEPKSRPATAATAPPHTTGATTDGKSMLTFVAVVLLVLVVATVAAVLVSQSRGSGNSTSGSAAASPSIRSSAQAPSPQTSVQPDSQLQQLRAADRSSVEQLIGYWVPQLSAKKPGVVSQGRTFTTEDVLADHLALRSRYPAALLLWSGDYPIFKGTNFWVTVVSEPFATPDAANAWCDTQGIARDDCFAKKLSHTDSPSGSTMYRR